MSDLEQAKRRDRKVYITDIAIEKVPYIEYHGYDEDKCKIMQELAKNVLLLSKEENDSNEVAITCDLGIENPLEQFGIALGTEHEVDILADTLSNQGTVHYMMREDRYDYRKAFELFKDCISDLSPDSPVMEQYLSALSFLAKCSEVGLYYR